MVQLCFAGLLISLFNDIKQCTVSLLFFVIKVRLPVDRWCLGSATCVHLFIY